MPSQPARPALRRPSAPTVATGAPARILPWRAPVPPATAQPAPGAAALGHSLSGLTVQPVQRSVEPAAAAPRAPSAAAAVAQPIQLALDVDLERVPAALRRRLGKSIQRFNRNPSANRNTREALHGQFGMVDSIERMVNNHLRDHSDEVTDGERRELFGLLRQTQEHHVDLVGRNLRHGHDLWLRDSLMSRNERQRTQALWRSLVQGRGNLKIETADPAFRTRTLAGFAHLLQGSHGRGLLGELNRNQGGNPERRVIVSDDHSQRFGAVGKNADPGSWAEGIAHVLRNEDLHTRLADRANRGTGSLVQISGDAPGDLADHESDVDGKPLFAPGFITLGHELGHARHNLRGTAGRSAWFDGDPLAGQELDRKLWSNPEELANITGEENAIRREHGLPERQFHATIRSATATRHRHDLDTRIQNLFDTVPAEHRRTLGQRSFGPLNRDLQNTDLSVPDNARALTERVDRLQRELPGAIWREQMKASFWSAVKPTKKKLLGLAGTALLGGLWWSSGQSGN